MRSLPYSLALALLACEPTPARPPRPTPELAVPPAPPEPATLARKRECIDRLLPGAEPRFHGLLRSLCAQWVNQSIPGMAAAVIEAGELKLHVELGVRCVGQPGLVEPSTAFRVGSISKTFTAALVLESLDPAARVDPTAISDLTWPAGMSPPTIDGLLRHRSGLGEIEPTQVVVFAGAWKPALAHSPAAGPAGEWHYSNAGYVILGALLEAETGSRYQELLRSHAATFPTITSDPTTTSGAACGHLQARAIPVEHDLDFMPGDPSWLRPAGGVLSSAEDLARFGASLDARQLVPGQPLPRTAWRHAGNDERDGWGLRSWALADGQRAFGHSGDTGTFTAELVVAPDRKLAVAVLANAPMQTDTTRLAIDELLRVPSP